MIPQDKKAYLKHSGNFGYDFEHAVVPVVAVGLEVYSDEVVALSNTTEHGEEQTQKCAKLARVVVGAERCLCERVGKRCTTAGIEDASTEA